jgi:hypothetical protein
MPELLSIERLFADGYHNAFTDLMRWKGHYYLGFRTAQHHNMPPYGDVVLYRSEDLASWELCGRFDTGGDDRDPKLIDGGDRLGVVFGTWIPRWGDGTGFEMPKWTSCLMSQSHEMAQRGRFRDRSTGSIIGCGESLATRMVSTVRSTTSPFDQSETDDP